MAASEVIQFRVTPEEKEELLSRGAARGMSLSEVVRDELNLGNKQLSPAEMFEVVRARACAELTASGLPELTEAEIVAYCDAIRQDRAQEAMRAYA